MSNWLIYANSYDSDAEFSGATKTVRFKVNSPGGIVQYFRTWLIGFNDPQFTNITAKIYADVNGSKGALLDNGNSVTTLTKAQITTEVNFAKEVYFQFDNLSLDQHNWYHFALTGVSSGFTEDSHIAWRSSYPFPVYREGLSAANLAAYPFLVSVVGAEF